MKKILLFIPVFICVYLLAGCMEQVTVTTGTLTTLPIDPVVRPMPLSADLNVSEQRATGEAGGPALEQERLVHEATANALGQDPPSIEGPDVLVGMNVFTAQTGDYMKVTVTGYPAYYANFRTAEEKDNAWLNIIMPGYGGHGMPPAPPSHGIPGLPQFGLPKQESDAAKLQTTQRVKSKHGFYFAPKYMLPLGMPIASGANAEIGWTYSNRMLFGIDFNFGLGRDGGMVGGGFSLGGVYDLSVPQMQIAYGGGVGLWYAGESNYHSEYVTDYEGNRYYRSFDDYRDNFNFLAPFIRLRWKSFELSYRGLLGMYSKGNGRYEGGNYYYDYDDGFGWNNNQIMLGLYFGGR